MSLDTLQQRLDYRFKDVARLRQALTHRSFGQPNNERLEFLGDSVVNHVVALALFSRFPDLREGELSRLRAQLVCQDALHGIALALQLGPELRLGEGELKSGGAERPSILSDALEAVFAAVYLDGGFQAAKTVIDRLFSAHLAQLDPKASLKDPKTRLQEWLQARRRQLPKYRLVETRGEAHAQVFEVECAIDGGMQTRGTGSSRRAAEQQAAMAAMEKLEQHAG